jgi:hypothetical protein
LKDRSGDTNGVQDSMRNEVFRWKQIFRIYDW